MICPYRDSMIKFDDKKKIFYSTKINDGTYISGFGIKLNGDARREDVLREIAVKNGIRQQTIVRLNQTHSTNIHTIVGMQKELLTVIKNCDGAVTSTPRTLLTILTADCVPLLLVDKQ